MKKAVVYYSASGVTRNKARELAAAEQADLIELVPAELYTAADLDWTDKGSRSTREMNDAKSRPALVRQPDVSGSDEIFLGFPIWWGLAPRIVETFLDHADLQKAAMVPFATSGGSGIAKAEKALIRAYPDIRFVPGRLLNGRIDPEQLKFWADAAGE